jgi:hypothetical protein
VFDSKKFLDAPVAKKMGEFAKAQQSLTMPLMLESEELL